MKPILKNFSGKGEFEYQIRYGMEENSVRLDLCIKTPFDTEYAFHSSSVGHFDSRTQSSTVGLSKALKEAESKWGLKLIKEDLEKVA